MLIDAHAHYKRPDELPARRGVCTLFCGTNPETAAQALALRGHGRMASCGLHPWHADRFTVTEMLPYIEQSAAALPESRQAAMLPPGTRVRHSVFGPGTVLDADADKGAHIIRFDGISTPRAVSFKAKLERLDG